MAFLSTYCKFVPLNTINFIPQAPPLENNILLSVFFCLFVYKFDFF